MASESNRAIALNSSDSTPNTPESEATDNRQMDIYRPQATPLPGNRPIADNSTEDMDDMLGYLD